MFSAFIAVFLFFSFLSCTFPGKDKGFKNTLKRVMKFLRVFSTNLPWDIRGAWEKTQRCLWRGKLKMEGALLAQHPQEGWCAKGWWDADGLVWFWGWGKFPMDRGYQGENTDEGNHLSSSIWDVWKQKELLFIKAKEKNVLSEHRCKGLKGHRGDF